jgi:ABC-2 type transport system ATP-binding protein
MESPFIEVNNIHKAFKEVKAVNGIDLKIGKGEFVALLGPNGAGKTTLVEMIEGIQKPDSGEILIMGKNIRENKDELHKILGIALQETRFIEKITVQETLQLFASFYKLGQNKINSIVNHVGLEEKTKSYVVNLSGGQKQKLALGIALLNDPSILLLDEPTTGLDPTARREIWNILINLKKNSQTSMILTTHYMEEAENLCDRIIILDKGKILAQGTLDELLACKSCKQVIEFECMNDKDLQVADILKSKWNVEVDNITRTITLHVSDTFESLPLLLDILKNENISIINLRWRRMTLDDLFIEMTGRRIAED